MLKLLLSITATLSIFAASAVDVLASSGLDVVEPAEKKQKLVVYKPIAEKAETTLPDAHKDLKPLLLTYFCKDNKPAVLRAVCREWKNLIDAGTSPGIGLCYSTVGFAWQKGMQIWYGFLREEEMLNTYLGGSLIYKRDTPEEKVFPIAALKNPFAGTFDLNGLEEGKYLSINTGLRPGINQAHKDKAEIWLIPWVLAKKMAGTEGSYLQAVMQAGWNPDICPFAILYNWWEDGVGRYVHCVWPCLNDLEENNLSALYLDEKSDGDVRRFAACESQLFHVSFLNSPKD